MEVWKTIPQYPDYEASNLGRIKSFKGVKPRILKSNLGGSGYPTVAMHKDKKQTAAKVANLVAMTFLNHIPCGHLLVVDHIDNNPLNSALKNLQLITQRENISKSKRSKCGLRGAYLNENGRWFSTIYVNGKNIRFGTFDTPEEAHEAYMNKLKEITK